MISIDHLHRMACLEATDIALIVANRERLLEIVATLREDYVAWFKESAEWASDEDAPVQDGYLESFADGEYGEAFVAAQYRQSTLWRRGKLPHSAIITSLSHLRGLFVETLHGCDSGALVRAMCRVMDVALAVHSLVNHLSTTLERFHSAAEREASLVGSAAGALFSGGPTFIRRAYMDHVDWKTQAYRLALGDADATDDLPLSPHACALGRWLDAGGMEAIPEGDRAALHAAHERLHELTRMAVEDTRSGRPQVLVAYLMDIEAASEQITDILRRSMVHQLSRLAREDSLTKLGNRRAFLQQMDLVLAMAKRSETATGLLVLDLDHFKAVNDRYGHPVGDELLRALAVRLDTLLRAADSAFRWGGEEFTVIVYPCERDQLGAIGARICREVAGASFPSSAGPLRLTVSIGGHLAASDTSDGPTRIFDAADRNLMEAKRSGRNRAVVT